MKYSLPPRRGWAEVIEQKICIPTSLSSSKEILYFGENRGSLRNSLNSFLISWLSWSSRCVIAGTSKLAAGHPARWLGGCFSTGVASHFGRVFGASVYAVRRGVVVVAVVVVVMAGFTRRSSGCLYRRTVWSILIFFVVVFVGLCSKVTPKTLNAERNKLSWADHTCKKRDSPFQGSPGSFFKLKNPFTFTPGCQKNLKSTQFVEVKWPKYYGENMVAQLILEILCFFLI